MTTIPIENALTLLSHDAVASAHAPLLRKEKPLILPSDGTELVAKLAVHQSFRKLTIACLTELGEFRVTSEFRLVHDPSTLDNCKMVALVYDPTKNEATPFVLKNKTDHEESEWDGPPIEAIVECDSLEALTDLLKDKDKHSSSYKQTGSMVYFPVTLLEELLPDAELQDDIPRLCYRLIERCKEDSIMHYKNGKVRKSIHPNITALLLFLVRNSSEVYSAVEFSIPEKEIGDQYAIDMADLLRLRKPAQEDSVETVSIQEIDQGMENEDVPPAINIPDPLATQNSMNSEELPDLPVVASASTHSSGSSDDSDDSEEEIIEPPQKKPRTPTKTVSKQSFSGQDLLNLANVFSTVSAAGDNGASPIIYGTRLNKLNKMNVYKINSLKNACTRDCISQANDLPESMVQLMENKTGPDMAAYMEGTLSNYNIAVCIGFCSSFLVGNLCNRLITSPTIQGFTNFAFGPREEESETYLLQQVINLSSNNQISEDDKKKLLNQKKYIPSDPDGLKSSIRNTVAAAKMCFGSKAFITKALSSLRKGIKEIDPFLKPYFATHGKVFGMHFAQAVHQGISMFLSKALNGITHMKADYLNFDELILNTQMQRLRISIQASLTTSEQKGNWGDVKEKGDEVLNNFKPRNQHLTNDRYRRLFSNRNRSGVDPPKMANGTPVCWNFHAKGTCRANCPRKDTHVKLNREEVSRWNAFTDNLNKRISQNNSGGGQGRDNGR